MTDRSTPAPGLARALDLRRNAAIGFGTGVALAAAAYLYRVFGLLGPAPDAEGSPTLFLMLAFVLAITTGALVTAVLTLRSALRLARDLD